KNALAETPRYPGAAGGRHPANGCRGKQHLDYPEQIQREEKGDGNHYADKPGILELDPPAQRGAGELEYHHHQRQQGKRGQDARAGGQKAQPDPAPIGPGLQHRAELHAHHRQHAGHQVENDAAEQREKHYFPETNRRRWREIGADSRICDLIDSQVTSIEAACEQLASTDPKVALMAAFEIIKSRLAELDRGDGPITPGSDESASPQTDAARTPETAAATATADMAAAPPTEEAAQPATQPEAAQKVQAAMSQLVAAVAAIEQADNPPTASGAMPAAPADPAPAPASNDSDVAQREAAKTIPALEPELEQIAEPVPAEALDEAAAAEAQDQAILELVAAEMGAPDPFEDEEFSRARTLGFDIEEPTAIDDDIVASFSEPAALTPAPLTPAPMTDAPVTPAPTTQAPMTPAPLAAAPLMAAALAPEPIALEPMAPEPAPAPAKLAAARPLVESPAPAVAPMPAPSTPAARVGPSTLEVSVAVDTEISVEVVPAAQRTPVPQPSNAALDREALATLVSSTAQAMPKPAYEPSLGSTLLSNGLLQRQQPSGNDPLTPIRRMSQPEKIAFFS
ncbi:MAG: hypothetical protein E6813_12395, partial [Bradyrhizobium sp.]|uniref:hypothetical protein n=1 Tax=Bradyrhizobium sp. TaxID=376 RepID=UPI0028FED8D8